MERNYPKGLYKKGGDTMKLNDIVIYYEKQGNFMVAKGTFYAWLYDEEGAGAKISSGEYDFILFPMGGGFSLAMQKGYVPPLLKIWTKPFQKDKKGIEHLLGIVQGYYDEKNNKMYIEMMTTNPKFRRMGINGHIIKQLREEFKVSQDDVIFDKPTDMGKKFMASKKFYDGGVIEYVLWATPIGKPMSEERIAFVDNEEIKINQRLIDLLKSKGYDRPRVAKMNMMEKPDFTKTIKKANGGTFAKGGEIEFDGRFQKDLDKLLKNEGWEINYYDQYTNIVPKDKAIELSIYKFEPYYDNITIKPIPKKVTLEWVMNKINKDKVYKNFSESFNKLLKAKGYGSINAYPTTYGIGVFVGFGLGIAETKQTIEKLLKSLGIEFTTEYSDAMWVFRYKISKSKSNIEKIDSISNKMANGGTINKPINNNNMDNYKFNQLPHIDTLNSGDSVVIEEGVFSGSIDKPTHVGERYIHCKVMGKGGVLDTLDLRVVQSVGANALMVGSVITRPIKNVLQKGRKLIVEPIGDAITNFKDGGINPDNKEVKEYFAHDSGNAGGVLVGKRHSEGGIKAINKGTGQPLEMEGGEVVITRGAVSNPKRYDFNGKEMTTREILSKLNVDGGGVSFAEGGDVPDKIKCGCNSMKFGGMNMTPQDFVKHSEGEYENYRLQKGIEKETKDHYETLAKLNAGTITIDNALTEIARKEMSLDSKYPFSE